MPYVEDKYKKVLDSHINVLANCVKLAAENPRDLTAVWDAIPPLAEAIKQEDKGCGYWGAFAGLLNYSCTEILLKVLPTRPNIRYWEMPIVAGLAVELEHLFHSGEYRDLLFAARSEMAEQWFAETPFGKDHAFGDVLLWTFANLACQVMPDGSRSSRREVAGVFRNIDAEFYRRLVALYEALKILESGDVSYAKYTEPIMKALREAMKKEAIPEAEELARVALAVVFGKISQPLASGNVGHCCGFGAQ